MAKVSGLSVCSSCGSGERGASTIYSSRSPAASRPSMSMSEMRLSASSATLCWATPSIYNSATPVPESRPTTSCEILSCGERIFRLTREVLVRRVSTKASLPPLIAFSTAGSLTERVSLVRVSKVRASPRESKQTAQ